MSNSHAIKPEDILPDGVDATILNGRTVRKGSIAAFLANVEIFENQYATLQQKEDALNMMKALAPAVIAIGLHKHVVFKNIQVEQILIEAESVC